MSADDEDAAGGGGRDQSRERRAFGKRIQRRQHTHVNHDDYGFDVEFIQQQAQQQGAQYAADIEADLHVVDFFAAEVLVGKQRRQPVEQYIQHNQRAEKADPQLNRAKQTAFAKQNMRNRKALLFRFQLALQIGLRFGQEKPDNRQQQQRRKAADIENRLPAELLGHRNGYQ